MLLRQWEHLLVQWLQCYDCDGTGSRHLNVVDAAGGEAGTAGTDAHLILKEETPLKSEAKGA